MKAKFSKHRAAAALALLSAMLAGSAVGCSSENVAAPVAGADNKVPAAARAETAPQAAPKAAPRSTFALDQNLIDPFSPEARQQAALAAISATPAQHAPGDLATQLQAAFQGVIGNGSDRIAIISNMMLEPGRSAVIALGEGAQAREVKVRCREISRDGVLLEIPGLAQPLLIKRPATL